MLSKQKILYSGFDNLLKFLLQTTSTNRMCFYCAMLTSKMILLDVKTFNLFYINSDRVLSVFITMIFTTLEKDRYSEPTTDGT